MESIKFTTDEIRKNKGYEGISDKEAEQLADFLAVYAEIIFDYLKEQQDGRIESLC